MAIRYLSGINVDSNTLFVDSANNRVGVGTASPSTTLDVLGKIKIGLDGTYGGSDYVTIGFGGTSNGYNRVFGYNGTSDGLYLTSATGHGIIFRTNGGSTDNMWIRLNGNVLIGTITDNGSKLQVQGDATFASGVTASSLIKTGGTSSEYLMADGSVSTTATINNYTQTFFVPNTGGTAQWVKLGTWTAAQGGNVVTVQIDQHSGYNATTSQNQQVYIYMKTSNGSSVDVNGFAGDSSFWTEGLNQAIQSGDVIWEANAAGVGATSYTLYVNMGAYTNASQYTVTTRGGTWANVETLTSPSGTTPSSTILLSENRFVVNNILTVGGASSGNVLIGTYTDAGFKLQVNGTSAVMGGNQLRLYRTDNATYGSIQYLTGAGGFKFDDLNSDGYTFAQAGSAKVSISTAGDVGIGTTSPISKLNLNGGTGDGATYDAIFSLTRISSTGNQLSSKIVLDDKDTNWGKLIFKVKTTASAGELDAYYTDAITIDNQNANVGIGTASPATILELGLANLSNPTNNQFLRVNAGKYNEASTSNLDLFNWGNNFGQPLGWRISSTTDSVGISVGRYLSFSTVVTDGSGNVSTSFERMRIASDGHLILKSTTSGGGTQGDFYVIENGGLVIDSSEGATQRYIEFTTGGTTKALITAGGNVLIGTTTDSGYKLGINGSLSTTYANVYDPTSWSVVNIAASSAGVSASTHYSPYGTLSGTNPVFCTGQKFSEHGNYSIWRYNGSSHLATDFAINNSGAATFSSSVTASSLIKSGGTSSQYLMADGSVSTTSNVAPRYVASINVSQTSYTTICTIVGSALASAVNMSFQGTSGNVVVNVTAQILVNHFQDITITTTSGFYSQMNIRVISNNNETYSVEAQVVSAVGASTDLNIEVFPLNSESVTFGGSPVTPGTTLVHTTRQGLYVSASEPISISSSNDIYAAGSVGVGTTSPGEKLTLTSGSTVATARFTNSTTGLDFRLGTDGVQSSYTNIVFYSDSGNAQIWKAGSTYTNQGGAASLNIYSSNGPIAFHPNGASSSNAMFISTSQNVLIGTTTDNGAKLQVIGGEITVRKSSSLTNPESDLGFYNSFINTNATNGTGAAISLGSNSNFGTVIYGQLVNSSTNEHLLGFQTRNSAGSGGTRMVITGNGNVGIGTTDPKSIFDVTQSTPTVSIVSALPIESSSDNQTLAAITFRKHYGIANSAGIRMLQAGGTFAYAQAHLTFLTTDDGNPFTAALYERMRITSGGNVLIGTTTDNGDKLQVVGNTTINGSLYLRGGSRSIVGDGGDLLIDTENVAGRDVLLQTQSGQNVGIGNSTPRARLVVGTQSSGSSGSGVAQDNSIIGIFGAANGAGRVTALTLTNSAASEVGNDATLSFIVAGNYSATGLISAVLQNTSTAGTDMVFSLYNNSMGEKMRMKANGNLLIGTTTDSGYKLRVIGGPLNVVSGADGNNTYLEGTSGNNTQIGFDSLGSYIETLGASTGRQKLRVQTFNGSAYTQLFIDGGNQYIYTSSNANVGIGVSSPTLGLEVADGRGFLVGNIGSSGSMYVSPQDENTVNGSWGIANDTADIWLNYRGYQDGFSYFRDTRIGNGKGTAITYWNGDTGNMMIGTTTDAGYKLDVAGTFRASTSGSVARMQTSTNASEVLQLANSGGDSGSVQGITHLGINFFSVGTNSPVRITAYQNGTSGYAGGMYFSTRSANSDSAPVEAMRITHDQLIGLGPVSSFTTTHRVWIDKGSSTYAVYSQGSIQVNAGAIGVGVTPSATTGRIDAGNDIVAYSTSDSRLKENITPIANALDKVKSLTGVEFDWKEETKDVHGYEGHDVGVIAQEVQAVLPEAIRTNDTGYLSVRYEKMIALLIEANKELAARVEEIEKKLK